MASADRLPPEPGPDAGIEELQSDIDKTRDELGQTVAALSDKLDLEGFHHIRIDHSKTLGEGRTHINGIENFWGFAKRRLKMYHGGWKKNFRLFLKEMEFRFNHRNDPDIIDHLCRRVLVGPV